jgi:hypothetical protein
LCHFHRRIYRRTRTRRYFTESCKKITRLCHNHRRVHRRLYRRIIPTESQTNLRTSRSAHMSDTCPSAQIPTALPTDLSTSRSARMSDTGASGQIPTVFPTDRKVWRDFWTFFVRISINFRRYYRRNLMPPTTINFRR